jgi:hypothetical protein
MWQSNGTIITPPTHTQTYTTSDFQQGYAKAGALKLFLLSTPTIADISYILFDAILFDVKYLAKWLH